MYIKESADSPSLIVPSSSEEPAYNNQWLTSHPKSSGGIMHVVLGLMVFGGIVLSAIMVLCTIWKVLKRSRHRVQYAQAGPYNNALITGNRPRVLSTPLISPAGGSECISDETRRCPIMDDLESACGGRRNHGTMEESSQCMRSNSDLPFHVGSNNSVLRSTGTDSLGNNTADGSSLDLLSSQRTGQLVQNIVSTIRQRRRPSSDEEAGNPEDGMTSRPHDERILSLPIAARFATIPARKPSTRSVKRSGYRAASDSLRSTLALAIHAERELGTQSLDPCEKPLPHTPDLHFHSQRVTPVARGVATADYEYDPYMAQNLTQRLLEAGYSQQDVDSLRLANSRWRGSLELKKRVSMRMNGTRQVSYGSSIHTDEADSSFEKEDEVAQEQVPFDFLRVHELSQTQGQSSNTTKDNNGDDSTTAAANVLQEVPTTSVRRNSQGSTRGDSQSYEKNHHRHGAVSIPVSIFKGRSDSTLRQSARSLSKSPETVIHISSPDRLDSPKPSFNVRQTLSDVTSSERVRMSPQEGLQANGFFDAEEDVRGRETCRETHTLTQKQRMTRNTPAASMISFPQQIIPGAFPDDSNNDDARFFTAPSNVMKSYVRKASSRSEYNNPFNTFSSISSTLSSLALDLETSSNQEKDLESGGIKKKRRGNIFEFLGSSKDFSLS